MKQAWIRRAAALVVLGGVVTGCGGGGGGVGTWTINLAGIAALDGMVTNDGVVLWDGGGPVTGDLEGFQPGLRGRQLFTFDRIPVPSGATITSAVLHLFQEDVEGNPYSTIGNIVVDYLDYGAAIDAGDYSLGAIQASVGVISSDAALEWKNLDVTTQVSDAVAAGRNPQFRLNWTAPIWIVDGANDYVIFGDTEASCCPGAHPPFLEVTYSTD